MDPKNYKFDEKTKREIIYDLAVQSQKIQKKGRNKILDEVL